MIGVYGVLAFSVSQRTREFGVRLAVGASPRPILGRLLMQGGVWIGGGILVGLLVAWQASRLAAGLLAGVRPGDPRVLGVVAVLMMVAVLPSWLVPARRAAQTDPRVALRSE